MKKKILTFVIVAAVLWALFGGLYLLVKYGGTTVFVIVIMTALTYVVYKSMEI